MINLDFIIEKMYNGNTSQRVTYSYGSDGSIARTTDYYTNTNTRFVYDLAGRIVSQREFNGTSLGGNSLKSYTNFTYADKTNYLTGIQHYSPLGTQTIGYRYGDLAKGEMPDQIYGVTWNGTERVKYTYDGLGRLNNKSVNGLNNLYTYEDVSDTRTTTLVKSVKTAAGTYTYTYDKLGNIISINDGTTTTSYVYDNLNQLVRANDARVGKTYTYAYTNGNITERKEYAYTTGELGEVVDTRTWTYGDSTWADLLTDYNGKAITYDEIGNPLTIGNKTLTWNGRQLQSITDGTTNVSYKYNGDGQRVSKTVNGVTTEYFYNGSIFAGQITGSDKITVLYNSDDAFGFNYNGTDYYYIKNAQNDVIAIADSTGKVIANYYYDSWGKLIEITGDKNIAELNPIRYRSYYYDGETEWYYLNTRYYDAEMCRFINADDSDIIDGGNDHILENNLFAYCLNNPVKFSDSEGQWVHLAIGAAVGAVVGIAGQVISDVVTSVANGKLTISNWQTYTGAFVGGAVGGAILGVTGNVGLANAATGFVTTGAGLFLEKVSGKSNKSWTEIGLNSIADGAMSYGLGKLPGVNKITKGRNSYSAVYKSGLTKLRNGTASRMSLKVISKGVKSSFVGGLAMDSYYGLKQHAYDRVRRFVCCKR